MYVLGLKAIGVVPGADMGQRVLTGHIRLL
jgi:hypothetical protein